MCVIVISYDMQDWESDLTLFESGVKVIPENVKIRNNYAMELKSAGRLDEARLQYQVLLSWDLLNMNTLFFGFVSDP